MTRYPLLNALSALAYIAGIVLFLSFAPSQLEEAEPYLAMPAFLSLLVLSVAFMAGTFFLTPLRIAFEGDPKAGARFFLQTLGAFGGIVVFLIAPLLILS